MKFGYQQFVATSNH